MQLKTYFLIAAATMLGAVEADANMRCNNDMGEPATQQWCSDFIKGYGGYGTHYGKDCCIPLGNIKRFITECKKLPHGSPGFVPQHGWCPSRIG